MGLWELLSFDLVAMTHPMAVTNCNIDMESLISDQNRSIATLAITTLLKTGMNQVTVFEVSPEVQIIDELFKQHSQGGNEYKKAIVDSIVAMTHPMAVTNCNIDMESLISDQNRSIATLAITTLLKTGMNQVWIA
ncbi:hypothetical protein D5086_003869 [Populus alba]|uniref:Uncharacterized protein n=1 Tax=Populus alba TaxID=43335 RepID=A0ACC4D7D7_POPAL